MAAAPQSLRLLRVVSEALGKHAGPRRPCRVVGESEANGHGRLRLGAYPHRLDAQRQALGSAGGNGGVWCPVRHRSSLRRGATFAAGADWSGRLFALRFALPEQRHARQPDHEHSTGTKPPKRSGIAAKGNLPVGAWLRAGPPTPLREPWVAGAERSGDKANSSERHGDHDGREQHESPAHSLTLAAGGAAR